MTLRQWKFLTLSEELLQRIDISYLFEQRALHSWRIVWELYFNIALRIVGAFIAMRAVYGLLLYRVDSTIFLKCDATLRVHLPN